MIVGLGGLGSPAAFYLNAAGIGTLGLADGDVVQLSNLQRQILFHENDLDATKSAAAARELHLRNSKTQILQYADHLVASSLAELAPQYDLILDCSDNPAARYDINSVAMKHSTPWIHGAVRNREGRLAVFDPRSKDSPCYECLFPRSISLSDNNATESSPIPVLAPLPGIIGSMMAFYAILWLGAGEDKIEQKKLASRYVVFDGTMNPTRSIELRIDPQCRLH